MDNQNKTEHLSPSAGEKSLPEPDILPHSAISVSIDGKKYKLQTYLTALDAKTLRLVNAPMSDIEYRLVFSKIIWKKIVGEESSRPSVKCIYEQPDTLFEAFIKGVLKKEFRLAPFYEKHSSESDCCKRFILAYRDCLASLNEDLVKVFSETVTPVIESLDEIIQRVVKAVTKPIEEREILEVADKRFQENKKAVCKWGFYGWSLPPEPDVDFFLSYPASQADADKQMKRFCSNKALQNLWAMTRKLSNCKKSDFDEAIFAFEQKKYKSCALLLFSLIDAKLIRFQKRFHDDGQIQVGTGAIRYFERRYQNEYTVDFPLLPNLAFFNTLICLREVYKRYPNFSDIPHIINRHFVAHGMTIKPVRKKDCVQLFYLYFNLLDLLAPQSYSTFDE